MSLDEAEYADAGWENANGEDWEHEEERLWPEADSCFVCSRFLKLVWDGNAKLIKKKSDGTFGVSVWRVGQLLLLTVCVEEKAGGIGISEWKEGQVGCQCHNYPCNIFKSRNGSGCGRTKWRNPNLKLRRRSQRPVLLGGSSHPIVWRDVGVALNISFVRGLHCLSSDSFLPCKIIKSRNGCGCGRTKWRNPNLKLRRRSQRPVLLGGSSHPIVWRDVGVALNISFVRGLHCLSLDSFLPCNIIKSRNGCGCGRTKWRNPNLKLRRRSQRPVLLGGSSHPIVWRDVGVALNISFVRGLRCLSSGSFLPCNIIKSRNGCGCGRTKWRNPNLKLRRRSQRPVLLGGSSHPIVWRDVGVALNISFVRGLHCLSSDSFLPCNIFKSRNGCGCGRTKWRNPNLKLRRRSQRPVLLGGSSHPIVWRDVGVALKISSVRGLHLLSSDSFLPWSLSFFALLLWLLFLPLRRRQIFWMFRKRNVQVPAAKWTNVLGRGWICQCWLGECQWGRLGTWGGATMAGGRFTFFFWQSFSKVNVRWQNKINEEEVWWKHSACLQRRVRSQICVTCRAVLVANSVRGRESWRHRDLRAERRPGWLSLSPLSVLSLAAASLYRVCLRQDAPFWRSGWNEENGRYWRRCRGTIAGKRNMVTICPILLWPLYSLSVPDCANGIYWFQSGCKSCKSACASVSACARVCVCVCACVCV